MDATRTQKAEQQGTAGLSAGQQGSAKALALAKVGEVAFWGTVVWGLIRAAAHYLNFTPYGVEAFARPILGMVRANSWAGVGLGALMLLVETIVAVFLYSLVFGKIRLWWFGLLYGLILFAVAGYFFRIGNWNQATLSTELAWYLSFGLFAGMSISLEQSDKA
ncbi:MULTISPECIES: YqhR family membrane protein [Brevibacillus]|uniref:DoxX family membrane protein n=1 Tax=Brevibacillus aydinogluensis TaxID=927786 RepID=A0AA48RHQ2_9BACL|nr:MULTISPECIES: YqhR family membrane protein [Brevibacillus]REK62369.1 MAG: hypothetical protein DF221_13830 [Brevibacillus sp.]MBR8659192.1 hypothetical protein [Brevibacillus sp. NL20B1]MDT3415222.1 hypothetical protein [Brevibacillus aydinogluensis]NNV02764.1 hypothetical protein [Brevibacillus sp. MCWH]CAJ1003002.1 DoxX family membrane protein [Brevibacillus aydinogluensis]